MTHDSSGRRALDRDVWAMAWPAMLSLLFTNAAELIDIAMVGRLGRESVAAVGYAAQCAHLVETVLQAVGIACVALMARAIGARRPGDAKRALGGSLVVGLSIALLSTLAVLAVPRPILAALDAKPHVAELSVPYFRLTVGATLLGAMWMTFDAAQRARKNTRIPLFIAVVMAGSKIALDLLLIFGLAGFPRLGLVGAGLASVIAQLGGVTLYVALGRFGEREGAVLLPSRDGLTPAGIRSVLRVAAPAMGERAVLDLALLMYFKILAQYGPGAIAAYAIGVRLLAFSWLPGIGFGVAAATLVGQALGASEAERARRAGWRSMTLALASMAVLGVVCAGLRDHLAHIFTHDAVIIEELLPFLLMLAVAQPFMGVHFTLSGALRGAGDTWTPLLGAAIGNWVLRVPLAWLAAHVLGLPVMWAWAALVADHVFRCGWTALAFRRGRWQRVDAAAPARG